MCACIYVCVRGVGEGGNVTRVKICSKTVACLVRFHYDVFRYRQNATLVSCGYVKPTRAVRSIPRISRTYSYIAYMYARARARTAYAYASERGC